MKNEYNGYVVPKDGENVETVKIPTNKTRDELGAWFYENYVSKRKPVLIDGLTDDLRLLSKWTNSYLKAEAGEQEIEVELATATGSFGTGTKTKMTFGQAVERMQDGDTSLYITTQRIELADNGQPNITSSPITQLLHLPRANANPENDIPLQPSLFGNLIPMNLNVWMGNNANGSTTGLHHDYHDNLYVLLRGRKRFRVYSPADTELLYTQGTVDRVHPNGRINYQGFPTLADGSEEDSMAAQAAEKAKLQAEHELAEAEKAVERGDPGAAKRLQDAEAAVDSALDALLSAGDTFDDFDVGDESDAEEFDESDSEDEPAGKRAKTENAGEDPREVPLNFSKLDLNQNRAERLKYFPLSGKALQMVCNVSCGQMLYLPAGWFHEVTSYTTTESTPDPERSGHLAFNYWMHPPDNLSAYSKPYTSNFWVNDWNSRTTKL